MKLKNKKNKIGKIFSFCIIFLIILSVAGDFVFANENEINEILSKNSQYSGKPIKENSITDLNNGNFRVEFTDGTPPVVVNEGSGSISPIRRAGPSSTTSGRRDSPIEVGVQIQTFWYETTSEETTATFRATVSKSVDGKNILIDSNSDGDFDDDGDNKGIPIELTSGINWRDWDGAVNSYPISGGRLSVNKDKSVTRRVGAQSTTTRVLPNGFTSTVAMNDNAVSSVSIRDNEGKPHRVPIATYNGLTGITDSSQKESLIAEAIRQGIDLNDVREGDSIGETNGRRVSFDNNGGIIVIKNGKEGILIASVSLDGTRTVYDGKTTESGLLIEGTAVTYYPNGNILAIETKGEKDTIPLQTIFNYDDEGHLQNVEIRGADGNTVLTSIGLTNPYQDLDNLGLSDVQKKQFEQHLDKYLKKSGRDSRTAVARQNFFRGLESGLSDAVDFGRIFLYFGNTGDIIRDWKGGVEKKLGDGFFGSSIDSLACSDSYRKTFKLKNQPSQASGINVEGVPGAFIDVIRTEELIGKNEDGTEKIYYLYYISGSIFLGPKNDNRYAEETSFNLVFEDGNQNLNLYDKKATLKRGYEVAGRLKPFYIGVDDGVGNVFDSTKLFSTACIQFDNNPFPFISERYSKTLEDNRLCAEISLIGTDLQAESLKDMQAQQQQQGAAADAGVKINPAIH